MRLPITNVQTPFIYIEIFIGTYGEIEIENYYDNYELSYMGWIQNYRDQLLAEHKERGDFINLKW